MTATEHTMLLPGPTHVQSGWKMVGIIPISPVLSNAIKYYNKNG